MYSYIFKATYGIDKVSEGYAAHIMTLIKWLK